MIHTIVFFQFTGEKAKGNWTRWFNSDNPFIYDEFAPGGDVETVQHQSWYKFFPTESSYESPGCLVHYNFDTEATPLKRIAHLRNGPN